MTHTGPPQPAPTRDQDARTVLATKVIQAPTARM